MRVGETWHARYVRPDEVEVYLAAGWRRSRLPLTLPHALYAVLMVREC